MILRRLRSSALREVHVMKFRDVFVKRSTARRVRHHDKVDDQLDDAKGIATCVGVVVTFIFNGHEVHNQTQAERIDQECDADNRRLKCLSEG